MNKRVGWQWLSTLVVATATAIAVASCGSSNTTVVPGQDDASTDDATARMFGGGDAGLTACVPKTCAQLAYTCGMNGDGCGGTLDCGGCPAGQYCGGGGYSLCGGSTGTSPDAGDDGGSCTPETCQSLNLDCGYAGDGCDGVLNCGSCASPQFCGGGGYSKCGGNNGLGLDGGATSCTPTTCAALGYTCGVAADGCGGVLNCGSCANPQYCGGGGFDKCGGNNGLLPDGGIPCTPTTCANLGYALRRRGRRLRRRAQLRQLHEPPVLRRRRLQHVRWQRRPDPRRGRRVHARDLQQPPEYVRCRR